MKICFLYDKTVFLFFGFLFFIFLLSTISIHPQDAVIIEDTINTTDDLYENIISGEFTPGKGFTVFKSSVGSLNISLYGLARYVNQIDDDPKYLDHLGREKTVDTRQDLGWHRGMIWLS
jgi:hypothetical protein